MYKYIQQLRRQNATATVNFYPGLNAAKGILVLMVILTHALPESMMLYFFYLFHMPLFLSISGYLLKKTAFRNGYRNYFKRAAQRLLIPWTIASLVYLPFSMDGRSLSQLTITDLIYPFYHLWYVPAYFIGVTLCYGVTQLAVPVKPILIITASFTILWYIFFRENHLPVTAQPLYWLGEKRFYAYLFFFFLGHTLRNRYIKISPNPLLLLSLITIAFAVITASVFNNLSDYFIAIPYFIFNTCLVLFLLLYVAPTSFFQHKFILLLNKQSLGIYLYHPLIMFTIYRILGDPQKRHISNAEGLAVGIITVLLTALLVWLIKQWSFANRYLLGIMQEEKEPAIEGSLAAA